MIATNSQIRDTLNIFIAQHQKIIDHYNESLAPEARIEIEKATKAINIYSKFLK